MPVLKAAIAFGILSFGRLASAQEQVQDPSKLAISSLYSAVPLFSISWTINKNFVQYDAKLKNGMFDPKEPVTAYWIMNQTDGHHEGLTLIERLKGYGFTIKPGKEPDTYDMVIVSVKQKTLHIARAADRLRVTLPIADCETAYLDHVLVQAHKWHFLNIPDYAELFGNDTKTGAECSEKVMQK